MEEHVCSLYNLFTQFAVAQVCHVFLSIPKYMVHAIGVNRRSTLSLMMATFWSSVKPTAVSVSSTRCRDAMGIIGQSLPLSIYAQCRGCFQRRASFWCIQEVVTAGTIYTNAWDTQCLYGTFHL